MECHGVSVREPHSRDVFFAISPTKRYIKLIYDTPYIHTPTGLVKRGVRTLKDNLLTSFKAGERFGNALDLSLDVMRKTPHTKLKKLAFELHYGRKPNTEITNLLSLDIRKNLTKNSAKPDTLQVNSFNGVGSVCDRLPMKTNHTLTTPDGRIIHKKNISKPFAEFNQDCSNNRGTGPRGPGGRFTRSH